jgi:hypothetical protein
MKFFTKKWKKDSSEINRMKDSNAEFKHIYHNISKVCKFSRENSYNTWSSHDTRKKNLMTKCNITLKINSKTDYATKPFAQKYNILNF